jgi:hypothetical protein
MNTSDSGTRVRRSEIVLRAESWLHPPVPFHRNRFHHNEYGIFRTDGPGYVSMAWAVFGRPPKRHGGMDVAELAELSELISAAELRAGDALLKTSWPAHIALFHEWADPARMTYWGYEQAAGGGTVHRSIAFPYDEPAGLYLPCRYRLVND